MVWPGLVQQTVKIVASHDLTLLVMFAVGGDNKFPLASDAFYGRRFGAALVDGDLLWQVMKAGGALQKAPCCSQIPLGSEEKSLFGFPLAQLLNMNNPWFGSPN